ncbi:unnamed protein product [Lathyrus oleraceus]
MPNTITRKISCRVGVKINESSGYESMNQNDDIKNARTSKRSEVETQVSQCHILHSSKNQTHYLVSSSSTLMWRGNDHTMDNANISMFDRNNRLSIITEHLSNSTKNENELDIFIKLFSLEEERVSNLRRPYLICKPTTSIGELCQYIALETSLQTEEIELYVIKECEPLVIFGDATVDPNNIKFEFLTREEENLAELIPDNLIHGYLVIGYKKKMWDLNMALY